MGSRLSGKTAIITGAGHGIGRAFSLRFAEEGAKIAAVDLDAQAAEETAELIRHNGWEAMSCAIDVSDEQSTRAMTEDVRRRFGGVDILVNNAAVFHSVPIKSRSGFMSIPLEEWDRLMAVNVRGVFLCTRAVYPCLKEKGRGKIINIASGTFFKGTPNFCHYVASKGAVIGLTRSLARELGKDNIAVNVIAPGVTLSDLAPGSQPAAEREEALRTRCFGRVETPEDLTGAAVFLASADSDFITGQTLIVDGGASMI